MPYDTGLAPTLNFGDRKHGNAVCEAVTLPPSYGSGLSFKCCSLMVICFYFQEEEKFPSVTIAIFRCS